MSKYDAEELSTFLLWTVSIGVLLIVAVLATFGLCKLGGAMFDSAPDLSKTSIAICEKQGGTPILEGTGDAYKSCALNGKSDTHNTVK